MGRTSEARREVAYEYGLSPITVMRIPKPREDELGESRQIVAERMSCEREKRAI